MWLTEGQNEMTQPTSQEDNLILQRYRTVMLMNALAAGNDPIAAHILVSGPLYTQGFDKRAAHCALRDSYGIAPLGNGRITIRGERNERG